MSLPSAGGHVYKTIVVDLATGHIIYVGAGKGADALDKFWKRVKKYEAKIEYVATDLGATFISSVKKNAPDAELFFDHYHVKKQMSVANLQLKEQKHLILSII
mgnify:CR=1 FL=1